MTGDAAFVLGLMLVPLALVSVISAWADERRPLLGGALACMALALVAFAWISAPEGLPPLRMVPEMALELAVAAWR